MSRGQDTVRGLRYRGSQLARAWEPWGIALLLALLAALLLRGWLGGGLPSTPRQEGLVGQYFVRTMLDELRQGRLLMRWNAREFTGYPWRGFTPWPIYLVLGLFAYLGRLKSSQMMVAWQLASFTGSGLAMYLYVRTVVGERLSATVAAVAYLWLPCHAHLAAEAWVHSPVWLLVPLLLYAEERALLVAGPQRWRWTFTLGVLAAILGVLGSEYAMLATSSVALYILAREVMAVRSGRSRWCEGALRLSVATLAALGLAAFVVLPGVLDVPTVGIQAKQGAESTFPAQLIHGYAVTPSLVLRAIARRTHLPIPYGGLPRMYNAFWAVAWYPGLVAPLLALVGLWQARRVLMARLLAVMFALALLQALDGLVPGNPFGFVPVLAKLLPFRSELMVAVYGAMLIGFGTQALLRRVRPPLGGWVAAALVGLIVLDYAPAATAFVGVPRYFSPQEEAAQRWLAAHRGDGGYRLWEPVADPREAYRLLLGIVPGGLPRFWGYYDNAAPLHTWELERWGDLALALRLSSVRYAVLRPDLLGDAEARGALERAGFRPVSWGIEGLYLFEAADWQPYARAYPQAALSIAGERRAALEILPACYDRGIALVAGPGPYLDDALLPEAARYAYVFIEGAHERRSGQEAAWEQALGPALRKPGQAAALPAAPVWSQGYLTWERPRPEEIRVETDLPQAAVVTVAEGWYPDWRVSVDGRDQRLLRVNYAFLGVWVPAGRHRVVFRYHSPWYVGLGAGISIVTALGLAVAWGRFVVRTTNRRGSEVRSDYLLDYLNVAPVSLALERAIECRLLAEVDLPAPLLDVGCGDGLCASILFAGRRAPDIGLDLAPGALRAARARGAYLSLVAGDAARLPFRTGSVGSILTNSVLEHIADLEGVLPEMHRVLKPGGKVVATVPTDVYARSTLGSRALQAVGLAGLASLYRRAFNRVFEHWHDDALPVWEERMRRAGFTVVAMRPYLSRRVSACEGLMYPSALAAWLAKRLLGRYILCPRLRRLTAKLFSPHLRGLYLSRTEVGGYVLLEMVK